MEERSTGAWTGCLGSQGIARERSITDPIGLSRTKGTPMLLTIAALLLIMWFFGMVSTYTLGGFIHILLIIAIIMVLVRIIRGERPL